MPFQRFVEPGRVAYIAEGIHSGKLCTIVDVIDQTRALVDGPESGVPRTAVRFKQMHLTKFKFPLTYTSPTRIVRKSWKDAQISEKWAESSWAHKIDARKRVRIDCLSFSIVLIEIQLAAARASLEIS
ncbi:Hypothetical predicted protein [Cloeon dipterum]|uniref:Large ribosomal subunit protein eL14 n=1 Tax=Cloeon dipterum TaxID=197152 RepID=A0A8S1CFZ8_9INSE|nr:Hypothetical predicted protein [Cloeon dipterum]